MRELALRRRAVLVALPLALITTSAASAATSTSESAAAARTGYLEICKQAAAGSGMTGTYAFRVTQAATGAQLTTVNVAVGGCSAPLALPTGAKIVTEVARAGSVVTAIDVAPAERKISQSLANRRVRVGVPAGTVANETRVTFTNGPTGGTNGSLKVCKQAAANSGSLVGQGFSFSVNGGAAFTVAAGAAGSPNCSSPTTYQVGTNLTITEAATAGTFVSAITGATSSNTGNRTADITIGAGANVVTYTNQNNPIAQTGYLEVCKEAADTFTTGSFAFTIQPSAGAAINRTVAVGQCTNPIQVPAGNVSVTEAARANSEVADIVVDPGNRLVARNLINRSVTVSVPVSSTVSNETLVTFYNRAQLAQLKVCKALAPNSGALSGTTFAFNVTTVAGTTNNFGVVAGAAGETVCRFLPTRLPIGSAFSVTEVGTANVQVTGVAVDAAGGSGSGGALGAGGSGSGTLGSGVNTITFTNQAYGTLEVCKTMAEPAYNGTAFQFSVNGAAAITVNGGQCSGPIRVPAGTASVQELARANFSLVGVTAVGPNGEDRRVSGTNPVTVDVPFGGVANETLVRFTNRVNTATLKICKATNFPSLVTGTFAFRYQVSGDIIRTTSLRPGQCDDVLTGVPVIQPNGSATVAAVVEDDVPATLRISSITYDGSGSGFAISPTNAALSTVNLGVGVNIITYTNDPRPTA